jgi:hypothetical protein
MLATVPASAQSVYVESVVGDGANFGILDLSTGAYRQLNTNPRAIRLSGLALSPSGILYGSAFSDGSTPITSQLYRVNTSNGDLTLLGNIGSQGNRVASIAFGANNLLYGLSINAGSAVNLIRIGNLTTTPATATVSSLTVAGSAFQSNGGLVSDLSGNLYATEGSVPAFGYGGLFRFGIAGGAITPLSPPITPLNPATSAGFNAPVSAMSLVAGGNVFAVDDGTTEFGGLGTGGIYLLDRTSGIATQTATYDASTVGSITAITGIVVIPEPGTPGLILSGLALLAASPLSGRW